MHGLEAEYANRINFVFLDIDDPATDTFKQTLGYRVQPHLFLVDARGQVLQQWLGPVTREDLVAAFDSYLSTGN